MIVPNLLKQERDAELLGVTRPVERTPNQVSTQQLDQEAIGLDSFVRQPPNKINLGAPRWEPYRPTPVPRHFRRLNQPRDTLSVIEQISYI